jgi:hypothetical protein
MQSGKAAKRHQEYDKTATIVVSSSLGNKIK